MHGMKLGLRLAFGSAPRRAFEASNRPRLLGGSRHWVPQDHDSIGCGQRRSRKMGPAEKAPWRHGKFWRTAHAGRVPGWDREALVDGYT